MTRTKFEPVDVFKRNEFYVVMRDWKDDVDLRWRANAVCYELQIGQILLFRGGNLGKAEFLTGDRKIVFLPTKQAFKIVGRKRQENKT